MLNFPFTTPFNYGDANVEGIKQNKKLRFYNIKNLISMAAFPFVTVAVAVAFTFSLTFAFTFTTFTAAAYARAVAFISRATFQFFFIDNNVCFFVVNRGLLDFASV
jgi:hypothetical protein